MSTQDISATRLLSLVVTFVAFTSPALAQQADTNLGDPDVFPEISFERGEVFARFYVDEFDSFNFPRSGYLGRAEWIGSREGLGADDKFDQMLLQGTIVKSWGPHTLIGSLTYNATISGTAPIQSVFRAGGFLNLSG